MINSVITVEFAETYEFPLNKALIYWRPNVLEGILQTGLWVV